MKGLNFKKILDLEQTGAEIIYKDDKPQMVIFHYIDINRFAMTFKTKFTLKKIGEVIKRLNEEKHLGFSDWKLPSKDDCFKFKDEFHKFAVNHLWVKEYFAPFAISDETETGCFVGIGDRNVIGQNYITDKRKSYTFFAVCPIEED